MNATANVITIKLGTFDQGRRQDVTTPGRPPHPFGSDDLRILRAWVEAEQASGSPSCQRPVPAPLPGQPDRTERCLACAACRRHTADVVSEVVTAIERCQGRQNTSGQLRDAYERIPVGIRALLGQREGDGLKLLLGRWTKSSSPGGSSFLPGLAGLTEDEAAVYWWDIRGWTFEEIQREMTPPGPRRDRNSWVKAERVEALLQSSRRKVRAAFAVDAR